MATPIDSIYLPSAVAAHLLVALERLRKGESELIDELRSPDELSPGVYVEDRAGGTWLVCWIKSDGVRYEASGLLAGPAVEPVIAEPELVDPHAELKAEFAQEYDAFKKMAAEVAMLIDQAKRHQDQLDRAKAAAAALAHVIHESRFGITCGGVPLNNLLRSTLEFDGTVTLTPIGLAAE